MRACRVFTGVALAMSCLTFDGARADSLEESAGGIAIGTFPDDIAAEAVANPRWAESARDFAPRIAAAESGDLIFEAGFDEEDNGGTSCGTAVVLDREATYSADTTAPPNWMGTFGPLASPAHDVIYRFVAGPEVEGSITPTRADYPFAMYLIPSCRESGAEPTPIGATATIGSGIDLVASGVVSGNTYYLAITGASSDGAGANGILNFTTPASFASKP
jgi:hypothetical protein